ncbi:MAG: hypothetical protein AB7I36_17960 [Rhodospirillaceae bacterium]
MFDWLKKEKASGKQDATRSNRHSRVGRRGICLKCGELKEGSYDPCSRCGFHPTSEIDLVNSLALNETNLGDQFNAIANQIRFGGKPQLDSKGIEALIPAVRQHIGMLGLDDGVLRGRDEIEALLGMMLPAFCRRCEALFQQLPELKRLTPRHPLVWLFLLGVALERSLLTRDLTPDQSTYLRQVFPYRLFHELCLLVAPHVPHEWYLECAGRFSIAQGIADKGVEVIGSRADLDHFLTLIVFEDEQARAQYRDRAPTLIFADAWEDIVSLGEEQKMELADEPKEDDQAGLIREYRDLVDLYRRGMTDVSKLAFETGVGMAWQMFIAKWKSEAAFAGAPRPERMQYLLALNDLGERLCANGEHGTTLGFTAVKMMLAPLAEGDESIYEELREELEDLLPT